MSSTQTRMAIISAIMVVFIVSTGVRAEMPGKVSVEGNYLGLINTFAVDNDTAADPDHDQFDFAVNIDFAWAIDTHIIITLQLQGGTGGGSLGLQGPAPVVTDLNVTFEFDHPELVLVIGSFDTPFGEQTASLSNNADSFRNPFLLNSLFYSAFGGTVGTLNTLGAMGILSSQVADLTLALTNGSSEGSENPDGNFEWVVSLGSDLGLQGFRIAGSVMQSDDRTKTGLSGDVDNGSFGADFQGWLLDGSYTPVEGLLVKGYYGMIEFDDNVSATKDEVGIWMGEAAYGQGPWQLAVRISGWDPDDDDVSGVANGSIPNPGLNAGFSLDNATGNTPTTSGPPTDQSVTRLQVGASWVLTEGLVAKLEYVKDDYDKKTAGRLGDVEGVILLLNGSF